MFGRLAMTHGPPLCCRYCRVSYLLNQYLDIIRDKTVIKKNLAGLGLAVVYIPPIFCYFKVDPFVKIIIWIKVSSLGAREIDLY